MSTAIASTLTPDQIAAVQQQTELIASTITTPVVDSNTFVFVAAFDGTDNDRQHLEQSGDPQMTNVGEIEKQIADGNQNNQDGQLAAALTGDTQTFRPVTLDLGGNGMGYMNNFIDIRRVG